MILAPQSLRIPEKNTWFTTLRFSWRKWQHDMIHPNMGWFSPREWLGKKWKLWTKRWAVSWGWLRESHVDILTCPSILIHFGHRIWLRLRMSRDVPGVTAAHHILQLVVYGSEQTEMSPITENYNALQHNSKMSLFVWCMMMYIQVTYDLYGFMATWQPRGQKALRIFLHAGFWGWTGQGPPEPILGALPFFLALVVEKKYWFISQAEFGI